MTAPLPFAWDDAPRCSRSQADLLNWFQRALPGAPHWRRWVREVLSETLLYPAPPQMWLEETHCLGQREPVRHELAADRITIGRGADAGIVASAPAIAREHARLHRDGVACRLEDLDSKIGTFLGGTKLTPGKPVRLQHGDRFTIFPYSFQLHIDHRWSKEDNADLMAGPPVPAEFAVFRAPAGPGRVMRGIAIEPAGTGIVLETSMPFLRELARRLLHPVAAGEALGQLEHAAIEYLLAAVALRANQDLAFPFQAWIMAPGALPPIADSEEGIIVACTIGLSDLTGLVRLFIPRRAVQAIDGWTQPRHNPPSVRWRCPVELGWLDLTPAELRTLAPGDVVLYADAPALLLPGARLLCRGEVSTESNFLLTLTDDWNEPPIMSETIAEGLDDGRLEDLPVRVSIVAGEREISYAELKQLGRGSIVELDRGPSDPVTIALNGRPAGTGELVRIDGRLGVRIVSWKESS